MARIFLKDEVVGTLQAAIAKLNAAIIALETTEQNVTAAVAAHQSVAAVNTIGTEGYQSAGILVKEGETILGLLAADASAGLVFPKIAAIGAPFGFDRVHVDAKGGGSDFGAITAYSKSQIGLTVAPWGSISVGNKVLLQRIAPTIGTPENLVRIQGLIMTVDSIDTSSTRLVFTAEFKYYNGESLVTHVAADTGGESDTCILRVVDA